jgi:hypothetical protein
MPNLAKESSSYLNPFFGLEARMVNRSSQEPVRSWSDRSLGLVVGDAIFFKPVVLTIAGTVTLLGTDARPTATLTLTIGYAAKTSLAL